MSGVRAFVRVTRELASSALLSATWRSAQPAPRRPSPEPDRAGTLIPDSQSKTQSVN